MTYINVPLYDGPEYVILGEDVEVREQVLEAVSELVVNGNLFLKVWFFQAPGERFLKGYDPTMGDRGYFFKLGLPVRDPLPLRERRIHY